MSGCDGVWGVWVGVGGHASDRFQFTCHLLIIFITIIEQPHSVFEEIPIP